uniref:FLYWCH-type domain-containing protein n=1 Tax=Panagrolaimus sp. ES5 TaxID=591445 RepID=A0AC34F1K9_9BILA
MKFGPQVHGGTNGSLRINNNRYVKDKKIWRCNVTKKCKDGGKIKVNLEQQIVEDFKACRHFTAPLQVDIQRTNGSSTSAPFVGSSTSALPLHLSRALPSSQTSIPSSTMASSTVFYGNRLMPPRQARQTWNNLPLSPIIHEENGNIFSLDDSSLNCPLTSTFIQKPALFGQILRPRFGAIPRVDPFQFEHANETTLDGSQLQPLVERVQVVPQQTGAEHSILDQAYLHDSESSAANHNDGSNFQAGVAPETEPLNDITPNENVDGFIREILSNNENIRSSEETKRNIPDTPTDVEERLFNLGINESLQSVAGNSRHTISPLNGDVRLRGSGKPILESNPNLNELQNGIFIGETPPETFDYDGKIVETRQPLRYESSSHLTSFGLDDIFFNGLRAIGDPPSEQPQMPETEMLPLSLNLDMLFGNTQSDELISSLSNLNQRQNSFEIVQTPRENVDSNSLHEINSGGQTNVLASLAEPQTRNIIDPNLSAYDTTMGAEVGAELLQHHNIDLMEKLKRSNLRRRLINRICFSFY